LADPTDCEKLLRQQIRDNSRLFFSLAHGLLRVNEAAEDAVQHALLRAWENRREPLNPSALKAWLCKVVVNESLRIRRRRKIEVRAGAVVPSSRSGWDEPADQALDLRESIAWAMEKLPDTVREIVVLRVMEGISGGEVSRMLGISPSTVSRQLALGMERLREHLADWKTSGA
jgi:RNA polymerase sigma-70 factor (ECF subfamily)